MTTARHQTERTTVFATGWIRGNVTDKDTEATAKAAKHGFRRRAKSDQSVRRDGKLNRETGLIEPINPGWEW